MSKYAACMLFDNQVQSEATYSGEVYFLWLLIAQQQKEKKSFSLD